MTKVDPKDTIKADKGFDAQYIFLLGEMFVVPGCRSPG